MKIISKLLLILALFSPFRFIAMAIENSSEDEKIKLTRAIDFCNLDEVVKLVKYAESYHISEILRYCYAYSNDMKLFNDYIILLKVLFDNKVSINQEQLKKLIKFGYPPILVAFLAKYLNTKEICFCLRYARQRIKRLKLRIRAKLKKFELINAEYKKPNGISGKKFIDKSLEKNFDLVKITRNIIKILNEPSLALVYAIDHSLELFKNLFRYNKNVNLPVFIDKKLITLLMIAIKKNKLRIAKFLIEQGATIDNECILIAINNSSYRMMKMLFEYGAEFKVDTEKNQQVFDNVLKEGNKKIIDLLVWSEI